jgi:hypothetical protein
MRILRNVILAMSLAAVAACGGKDKGAAEPTPDNTGDGTGDDGTGGDGYGGDMGGGDMGGDDMGGGEGGDEGGE